MKVAVALSEGNKVSSHFGRSSDFLVFDIVDGKIASTERRPNTFTAHARGECSGDHHQSHGAPSHASIVEALSDCRAVLCGGMGSGAAEALSRGGIQPFVLSENCTPECAVTLFLDGKLPSVSQGSCGCHS